MRRPVGGVLVLLAGGLAGCLADHTPPIDPAQTAAALDSRSLDSPRLHQFIRSLSQPAADAADAGRWTPAALTLAALYFHPEMAIDRAKVAEAKARIETAGALPNPSFTVAPTKHTSPVDPVWTVGLAVNLLIETMGKRAAREAEATATAEAARHGLAASAWKVRTGLMTALTSLWIAEKREVVIEHRRVVQERLVGMLAERRKSGAASSDELGREELQLDALRLEERQAEDAGEEARAALALAIGVPVSALSLTSLELASLEQPPAGSPLERIELRRSALLQRSDVQAAFAEYRAADAAVRLQLARQWPDLTLGPSYNYQEGDNETPIALTVELPLLNQNQGPIAETMARRREAAAALLALQARIANEIDGAFADYDAARLAVALADRLRQDAHQGSNRVERSFGAGQADHPSLLRAQLTEAAAELSRLEAVLEERRALDAIEAALQHPVFDPEAAVFMLGAADPARSGAEP